jgi:hypothetical protein
VDYAKQQIDDPTVGKVLNDIIITKQKNFERASPEYVALDRHDMIGTHYLIYDVSNVFHPKLVAGIRSNYEARAQSHHLNTPFLELLPQLPEKCQKAYSEFRHEYPMTADCGSLIVDSNYTFKNTGLKLVDICYAMIYVHISRMGYTNILGCTNERFRSSRWLENIGSYKRGLDFIHPIVPDSHLLIMIEKFNVPYIKSVCASNENLFNNILELVPAQSGYMDIQSAVDKFIFDKEVEPKEKLKLVS